MNRLLSALPMALLAAAAPAARGGEPWFDAGIAGLPDWPSDGSDLAVPGAGSWRGTASARLNTASNVLDVIAPSDRPLSFEPRSSRDFADGDATIRAEMSFPSTDAPPPLPPANMKAALTAVGPEGGPARFWGLAKDPAGPTNVWTELEGAVPGAAEPVPVEASFAFEDSRSFVRYAVDGVPLANGVGEAWLEIAVADTELAGIGFLGRSSLAALSGEAVPPPPATLAIPALEHMSLVSVTASGAALSPTGGVYTVESGTQVVVAFAPEDGYVLDAPSMSFAVRGEMELPVEGRPTAVDARTVLRINEIGASNGTTVNTANGGLGLDWVELRNDADFEVDLTGWYLFDDPTKKQSKWEKIQGDGRIPAKGYRIVWCDKTYTNFVPAEAFSRIGLSTSGEPLFLATPAGTKIDEIENFGRQIKDVSFGPGHLSRTVLPASAEAEYRVGAGEWTSVFGPVGMAGPAGGFKVVSYQMVSGKNVSNMDRAEEYLRDPAAWASVSTNENVSAIAFREGSDDGDFSGYAEFPGASGDNFVVVASGSVSVPRGGLWTFAVGSDDGFTARLSRLGDSWSWECRAARGYAQSVATFNLDAGVYDVELVYFQNTSGAVLDFSVAEGEVEAFDAAAFRLVGSAESGVPHGGALGAQIAADLSDAMPGATNAVDWRATFAMPSVPETNDALRLRIRYADGFAARLNGTEFARVDATNARPAAEALGCAYFDIPRELVAVGANLLEVTGFNDDVDDAALLLSPEVVWEIDEDRLVYFPTPTPGAPNLDGGRTGFTPAVAMSEPRGWKTEPFDLALSCAESPAAAIYYTLDGSSPVAGATNTFRYTAPFRISSNAVVRAAVPDVDSILQADTTATYLFLADVLAQRKGVVPAGFPASLAVNNQKMVYGMATAITEGDAETRERLARGFTNSLPAISIVIDPESLFDKTRGIYVNATGNGRGWERMAMVEQIDPVNGAANEFNVPAGLRIRGAFSRNSKYPKHSFRLFFRSEYGAGKLEHPMFGDEGSSSFDKIDLRTEQNGSWANGNAGTAKETSCVHELFARDSERDMGTTYNRSRYLHLFLNGVYWGLYQTEERVDQYYAASYNGGEEEDYDVVRTSQPGYNTGVVEGEGAAWENLWRITTKEGYGPDHPDNYNRVRGLAPDGTRDPSLPVYVDVTNLIPFLITAHFAADTDAPAASGGKANNILAYRCRVDGASRSDGFKWNRHDAENSLGIGGGSYNSGTNLLLSGTRGMRHSLALGNFNPCELHYELCSNAEYRVVFADLVYRHVLRPGGAMTATNAALRFRARMAEIDDAIVCEAARWGHVPSSQRTRAHWLGRCQKCLDFIDRRTPYLVAAYRELGWYPSIDAPTVTNAVAGRLLGGETVGAGARVFATGAEAGTVYFTTDGSDPRLEGGAVNDASAAAFPLAEGLAVPPEGVSLKLRVRTADGEWSALEELSLEGEPAETATLLDALRVAALYTSTEGDGDTGEFIVLTNLAADAVLDLSGARLVAWNAKKKTEASPSLTIGFDAVSIAAGESLTLEQATAFGAGQKLTNGQVGLRLYDATNALVQDCFVDAGWWGGSCDGTGAFFLAKEFGNVVTNRVQWRPSATPLPASLRVAAVYSSTAGGTKADGNAGDVGEFVVLTNLDATAKLDLADARLVAWNAKKKTEDDPSLVIGFTNSLEIAKGGAATLDQATWFGAYKLVNSKVGLRIYDAAGALVQDVIVDADWWDKACDQTGAHFVATNFGAVAKTTGDWRPSFPLVADADARAVVAGAIAGDARIKPWLDGLGATDAGGAAIAAFDGGESALLLCWLVDAPPEADPGIVLEIPGISFDADLRPVLGGRLLHHGAEQTKGVNGAIRLYHAETLAELPGTTNSVEFGRSFPVEPAPVEGLEGATRFFQLRLE